MKVLHLPYTFYPEPVGGTEVYVEALARAQRGNGVETFIAAPAQRDAHYEHSGLPVWRFAVADSVQDVREMYGEGDIDAARAFDRVLQATQPDLVHMHAFTRAVSLRAVRAAKDRGIPVVFSYHTPTVSCQRGTLMRWGAEVCDGALEVRRCAQCALHAAGLNQFASRLIGTLPPSIGEAVGAIGLTGGVWTALRMSALVELRHATFRRLTAEVDHVVALCDWVKQVLLRNGVPSAKITVCRQGLVQEVALGPAVAESQSIDDPLRVVFLGRLDATKGVHVLLQALASAPDLNVQLDIYGIAQGESGAAYFERLKLLAANDARIRFQSPVAAGDIVSILRQYHILAVPSQWLETGPMVVLEAFAAGIPVIGSNLGGIAELVRHDLDGLLVHENSSAAWFTVLRKLTGDPGLLPRLRRGIRPSRTVSAVAQEIAAVYRSLEHLTHGALATT